MYYCLPEPRFQTKLSYLYMQLQQTAHQEQSLLTAIALLFPALVSVS